MERQQSDRAIRWREKIYQLTSFVLIRGTTTIACNQPTRRGKRKKARFITVTGYCLMEPEWLERVEKLNTAYLPPDNWGDRRDWDAQSWEVVGPVVVLRFANGKRCRKLYVKVDKGYVALADVVRDGQLPFNPGF